MSLPSKTQYLDTKVLTASQPSLHLMLLDGAIRFGKKAHSLWNDEGEEVAVDTLLSRAIDIVEELCMGVAAGKHETSKQLEEQYAFIFRELITARINHDLEKLAAGLSLLEYQRETWKLAGQLEPEAAPAAKPVTPASHLGSMPVESGLSLEA